MEPAARCLCVCLFAPVLVRRHGSSSKSSAGLVRATDRRLVRRRFGRRPVFLAAAVTSCLLGVISAFSTSYTMFAITRALCGLGLSGMSIIVFALSEKWPQLDKRLTRRERTTKGIGKCLFLLRHRVDRREPPDLRRDHHGFDVEPGEHAPGADGLSDPGLETPDAGGDAALRPRRALLVVSGAQQHFGSSPPWL